MNVLLLTYYFSGGLEGTGTVFVNIAELLAKNGHKVWVVTNMIEGINYPQHENIRIIFVSSPRSHQKIMRTTIKETIRYSFFTIRAGLEIIKNEKIDIIHSNAISGIPGSFLSLLTSKPHIVTIHQVYSTQGFWDEWLKEKGNTRLKAMLGRLLEKLLVKLKSSAIHTVSELTRDNIIALGARKPIYVIHNAIPIEKDEDVETNPFQFVSVGRLVPYKNIQVAINAIKKVKESFPKVTLFIVGKGLYREELEQLVTKLDLQGSVKFKGHVSETEKNRLISSSQALVFPSFFESFGIVILEAFSKKKPVLASNMRPLSDNVEDKKTGLLISPRDETEWAKAMEYILREPESALKMGRAGRKVLEERYNLGVMWNGIIEMYDKVIKGY